jgi:hypothetical protein
VIELGLSRIFMALAELGFLLVFAIPYNLSEIFEFYVRD